MDAPYVYDRSDLPTLLLQRYFPERTGRETVLMRDFIKAHGQEYDRIAFSVRIGEGIAPNPDHMPGVQEMTRFNSRMRIDMLGWKGNQADIIEVKERVLASVLGQLIAYRQMFLEENPGAHDPRLIVVGRTSTTDALRVLTANGVTVYLYDLT
jgi:hypothetical protein